MRVSSALLSGPGSGIVSTTVRGRSQVLRPSRKYSRNGSMGHTLSNVQLHLGSLLWNCTMRLYHFEGQPQILLGLLTRP